MKIERHPALIEDDLPSIYAHIVRDNSAAAERVLDAVEATFAEIAAQPECGVMYTTRNPAMSDVRMLPVNGFGNYLIFYRVENDVVRVLYLVHGARHLPRLFRLPPVDETFSASKTASNRLQRISPKRASSGEVKAAMLHISPLAFPIYEIKLSVSGSRVAREHGGGE